MQAVRVHETGGPEVLSADEVETAEPGPGEVRVAVAAAGLNFIDTYHRGGNYPLELPAVLGVEAAGTVDAVGDGVEEVSPGDRVAYAMQRGAYADYAVVEAWKLVPVPDDLELRTAAAVMLQGMTAHYLTHSTYPLGSDDTALVLAAAGGVGHLLVQIAKMTGARVLATASTNEKVELARRWGADDVIQYTEVDFGEAVTDLTDDGGVDVVYDGVGQATFDTSLSCLRPRGYCVLYGAASGPVEPLDPQVLNRRGSLFLTRPSLGHYVADREELRWRAGDLFGWLQEGSLHVQVDRTFPLTEAADAHRYIEGRQTKGKVLLLP